MVTISLIIKAIVVLAVVYFIAQVINWREEVYYKGKKVPIPFKESMDLLSVPVVTFVNGNKKLHFLLDTGGDYSYIDKSVVPTLTIKSKNNDTINIVTGAGKVESEGKVTFTFSYKEHTFEETFVVQDLASHFNSAFGPYGVTVHGVLGSSFFAKHKYEINYEDLIAYSKV